MKIVGVFEAKTKLSELCEEVVRTGETVIISRRGRPLVQIAPLPELDRDESESVWDTVRKLDKEFENEPDGPDFEPPPRHTAARDPLANYWE
jgi:prevent-host-death family protein